MSIEAMKLALEAIEDLQGYRPDIDKAIEALHAALSQQPATGERVMDVRCEGCGYMTHHREHMGCVRAAKQHTRPAPSVPATGEPVDFPAGAIVNGRTLMDRIEAYPFESEGGDLRMCSDWHELRRCFEHLADYVSPRPAPSVPEFSRIAKRKLDELQKQGFGITGYAIQRGTQRGFITNGGFVGWWRSDQAPCVPDDVRHIVGWWLCNEANPQDGSPWTTEPSQRVLDHMKVVSGEKHTVMRLVAIDAAMLAAK